jgi:hypothetical protein
MREAISRGRGIASEMNICHYPFLMPSAVNDHIVKVFHQNKSLSKTRNEEVCWRFEPAGRRAARALRVAREGGA